MAYNRKCVGCRKLIPKSLVLPASCPHGCGTHLEELNGEVIGKADPETLTSRPDAESPPSRAGRRFLGFYRLTPSGRRRAAARGERVAQAGASLAGAE